ncbi:hypothetical protein CH341_09065 [Rhodoplanes roseus]|uniref:DUF6455 domain-containing protein n=2 Tax=Rhodoplanes roseus TaxID=29409 RepID=A0A327L354_9BRAD|nr:hypothetical protein CH341_09065 [Rhodoplanes roseus]
MSTVPDNRCRAAERTMRDFDRFDRFSANIGEMMERLGIECDEDVDSYFGRTLGSVIRSCQVCRSAEVCSNWLARAPVAVSRAPAFCPYAERLDGLALDQAVLPPRRHTVH